jgi:phenylalanyl-tRNA synthetase beta chain
MKISYNWLQTYFEKPLPKPDRLAEELTMHSFEVEDIEEVGNDSVLDIDVLPNRAHDCLAHHGIAKEVSILFNVPPKRLPFTEEIPAWRKSNVLSLDIENENLCSRYSAVVIEEVRVGPSPLWLKKRLNAIGQKSINNIVDAANYVMFDLGQPLHIFDMDKIRMNDGTVQIGVRTAHEGEKITTLDGSSYFLRENMLLITNKGVDMPIGIAGIKGGKIAEVDGNTRNIVIEAANFNPQTIRKTSHALNLRTDASLRFEHDISPLLTMHALREVVMLILDIAGDANTQIEGYGDVNLRPRTRHSIKLDASYAKHLLGASIDKTVIQDVFEKMRYPYIEKQGIFEVTVPFERLDLGIEEDLIEEVGRIYGYENIKPVELTIGKHKPGVNKLTYYTSKMRRILATKGFSEVYTYTFVDNGEVGIENPIACDKGFLRSDLKSGLERSMLSNAKYADLLGLDQIRIFEIGRVFTSYRNGTGTSCDNRDTASLVFESLSLGLGVLNIKGRKVPVASEVIKEAVGTLKEELGFDEELAVQWSAHDIRGNKIIAEILNIDLLIERLPCPEFYEHKEQPSKVVKYKKISPYPYVLRDIAVWIPKDMSEKDVFAIIKKQGGDLLVRHELFDVYEKEDKTSYAYRLVFQSNKKTLTDKEVGDIMKQISMSLNKIGLRVR